MKEDELLDPMPIGLFGSGAIVLDSYCAVYLIDELGLAHGATSERDSTTYLGWQLG